MFQQAMFETVNEDRTRQTWGSFLGEFHLRGSLSEHGVTVPKNTYVPKHSGQNCDFKENQNIFHFLGTAIFFYITHIKINV